MIMITLRAIVCAYALLFLAVCSTDTYVSQENVNKYDERVQKFLIAECLAPQREVHIGVAEHFEFDKSELKEQDYNVLNQFVSEIKTLKGRIIVAAHTDYQGSIKYNEALSKRRAESIQAYILKDLTAANYQWQLKYYGEKEPITKKHSVQANAENRRAYLIFEQTLDKELNPACLPPEPKRKIYVTMASHFDFDKALLKEKDKSDLDKLALKLNGLTGKILIAGHTDYQGALSYNIRLSKARSVAVQAYLKTKIDTTQYDWEIKSLGETDPIIAEHTLKANAKNRRDFVIFTEGPLAEDKIESLTGKPRFITPS